MDRGTRARASCTYAHLSTIPRVYVCLAKACVHGHVNPRICRSTCVHAYACVCVRARDTQLCRARWSTETQHLRGVHETVAPGILSRSRRPACGPPPSPSPDTLSFALTPYPSSRLHPSHPSPSLLLHPRTPSSYYHLLRHLHRGSIHDSHHRRRSSPRPLRISPSLSLSLPIVRSSLGCTSSAADRSSPPRCTPGGYARGARTDLSNPHGLPRCATFAAGLCKGGMYVRVGAHSYERGEIFRLCADCLSRERRYTRSYTCRAVGMLDIRGGGPLAYIFTIGFIERALVNGGHVVHSHLGEGISSSRRTTSVQRGNTACRKKQVQFSSRPLFPPSSRLMRAVTQEGRRV